MRFENVRAHNDLPFLLIRIVLGTGKGDGSNESSKQEEEER